MSWPTLNENIFYRTKWKRQTAVGLELLAESGNFAALEQVLPPSNPMYVRQAIHSNPANMRRYQPGKRRLAFCFLTVLLYVIFQNVSWCQKKLFKSGYFKCKLAVV